MPVRIRVDGSMYSCSFELVERPLRKGATQSTIFWLTRCFLRLCSNRSLDTLSYAPDTSSAINTHSTSTLIPFPSINTIVVTTPTAPFHPTPRLNQPKGSEHTVAPRQRHNMNPSSKPMESPSSTLFLATIPGPAIRSVGGLVHSLSPGAFLARNGPRVELLRL